MRAVRPLLQAVADAGVPRARLLRAARIDPRGALGADAQLAQSKLFELFELSLDQTGDPAFGLHSIERMRSEAASPLAALMLHAMTLRDALRSMQEFRGLFGAEATFAFYEQDGKVWVRCQSYPDASLRAQRFLAEVSLGGLYRFLRDFRYGSPAEQVTFAYPAPEYASEYQRFFDARARFEQSFTGLCFDAAHLSAPAPNADSELHETLSLYAKRRLLHLTEHVPWSRRVHEALVWQPAPRNMTMPYVARRLGVSVRSLRRYLSNEGKAFAELANDALAEIAKSCLLDERRTIMQTAHELGFADNTAFHRAFKRWTGLTPMAYRRKQVDLASGTDRTSH